jgi:hypothetical protein
MTQSTTKRYKAVQNTNLNTLKLNDSDMYQYGCEFEFYIDIEKYNLQDVIDQIKNGSTILLDHF